ncbi:hypothetical protein, partial [Rubrivivax sp. A210]|uniref:hypothetical protein n=1 Tax=Rubrivivax sp. A210 TaxID=2772301 RepID=UPI00191ACDA4
MGKDAGWVRKLTECAVRQTRRLANGLMLAMPLLAQAGVLGTPSLSPLSIEATVASAVTVSISITDPNYILG